MRVVLSSLLWISKEHLSKYVDLNVVRRRLIIHPKEFDDFKSKDPIKNFKESQKAIGVPIKYGISMLSELIKKFPIIREELRFSDGRVTVPPVEYPKTPDLYHELASEDQPKVGEELLEKLDGYPNTALLKAPTAFGKTAMTCYIAATLGLKTLVIVHNDNLLQQWQEEVALHLGLKPSEIGVIQQNKCQFSKKFVIGSMASIAQKEYPKAMYKSFSMVAWDEVHKCGAPTFSQTIALFPQKYKLGLTATPDRKDDCEALFLDHLGNDFVNGTAPAMKCKVLVLYYVNGYGYKGNMAIKLNKVARDEARNRWLASKIYSLYKRGRTFLGVSDRIDQIESIIEMLIELGIPREIIGQLTRQKTVNKKKVNVKQSEIERIKKYSKIILGTYGMAETGLNIKRLDAGMDLTPRGSATQLLGRIRRRLLGKLLPIWLTPVDVNDNMFKAFFYSRLKDYNNDPTIEVVYAK